MWRSAAVAVYELRPRWVARPWPSASSEAPRTSASEMLQAGFEARGWKRDGSGERKRSADRWPNRERQNHRFAGRWRRGAVVRSVPRRHGKEGVAGSSPAEGSEKPPAEGGFFVAWG